MQCFMFQALEDNLEKVNNLREAIQAAIQAVQRVRNSAWILKRIQWKVICRRHNLKDFTVNIYLLNWIDYSISKFKET